VLSLLPLVSAIKPYCYHVINYMFNLYFGVLILMASKVPVVSEFIDITSTAFSGEKRLEKYTHPELEFLSEKILWEKSDGVVFKDDPKCASFMKTLYNVAPPTLHFCSYVTNTRKVKEGVQVHIPLRLVYVGGVHPKGRINDATELHQSLYDVAVALTQMGYRFDIYNAFDDGTTDAWNNFVELSQRIPLFFYHTAIPIEELPQVLSQYDVAWYVFDFSRGKVENNFFYDVGIASKLFVYIEADLPVIIAPEHKAMADIITHYDIGHPLSFKDIDRLPSILTNENIQRWQKNLEKAKRELAMEKHVKRLAAFYHQIKKDFARTYAL